MQRRPPDFEPLTHVREGCRFTLTRERREPEDPTTATIAKARLHRIDTATLIAQYDLAISSYAGRYTNTAPRQKRINHIVDLLGERADQDDQVALAWFAAALANR